LNRYYKGVFLIVISTIGYGMLPVFTVNAYKGGISVSTLLFIRFLTAAVFIFLYMAAAGKKLVPTLHDIAMFLMLGGIIYTLQSVFYFSAIKRIPASLAVLILYTYPIAVCILSFFIDKEKPTLKIIVSLFVSFAGLFMVVGASGGRVNTPGIVFAAGASVVYSVYVVFGNHVISKAPPLATTAFVTLFASAGNLLYGLSTSSVNFRFENRTWIFILGMVLFSTILTIFTFFWGLEILGPARASILSMLEPLFVVLFSMAFLGESLRLPQLIGGVVLLAGVTLVVAFQGKGGGPGMA